MADQLRESVVHDPSGMQVQGLWVPGTAGVKHIFGGRMHELLLSLPSPQGILTFPTSISQLLSLLTCQWGPGRGTPHPVLAMNAERELLCVRMSVSWKEGPGVREKGTLGTF